MLDRIFSLCDGKLLQFFPNKRNCRNRLAAQLFGPDGRPRFDFVLNGLSKNGHIFIDQGCSETNNFRGLQKF